ncbi:hypothetical protein NDU88_001689 [Pleurodeles waltl]|uniref:Uncharacterized protein n=1 Tax=Pleurodeles waltl TaxID=8319 RepID=A0AAV7S9H3_PLEWA|nr:hypothetical protein NDU88_001689 [Pleurodeles waltl]
MSANPCGEEAPLWQRPTGSHKCICIGLRAIGTRGSTSQREGGHIAMSPPAAVVMPGEAARGPYGAGEQAQLAATRESLVRLQQQRPRRLKPRRLRAGPLQSGSLPEIRQLDVWQWRIPGAGELVLGREARGAAPLGDEVEADEPALPDAPRRMEAERLGARCVEGPRGGDCADSSD